MNEGIRAVLFGATSLTIGTTVDTSSAFIQGIVGLLALAAIIIGARAIRSASTLSAETKARESAESLAESERRIAEIERAEKEKAQDKLTELSRQVQELQLTRDLTPLLEKMVGEFGKLTTSLQKELREASIEREELKNNSNENARAILAALEGLTHVFSAHKEVMERGT